MRLKTSLYSTVAAIGIAGLLAFAPAQLRAQTAVAIDGDDIGGVVTGASGPEAGVWVIAETTDLPTKYAKMVVTDDQGRYVVPDLPKGKYKVWVRGYGLVDSPKVDGEPGQQLNLRAVPAPNDAAAAQYYPAIYWYSMMQIPHTDQFGGKSNIPDKLTQADWLKQMKNIGCIGCHQLGQASTRTTPAAFGEFKSGEEAWMRRVQAGQSGEQMTNQLAGNFGGAPFKYLGEWTDRIAKGELPKTKPTRPQGVERNIVVSSWEWSTPDKYLHDLIASDRRNPTVNANGPLFGSPEYSTDNMPILDPKTNKVTFFKMPVQDPSMPEALGPGHAASIKPLQASAYWGDEKLWDTRANNHNCDVRQEGPGVDRGDRARHGQSRVLQEGLRPSLGQDLPARSVGASGGDARSQDDEIYVHRHLLRNPSPAVRLRRQRHAVAQRDRTSRGLGQHQDVRRDRRRGEGAGLVAVHSRHQRQRQARRLCRAQPADRSGQGQAAHPGSGPYAVMPSPVDGSIWYTVGVFGGPPGFLRFDPATGLSEVYNVPMPAFGIRGGDIDKDGVAWGSASSGHLVSFDRRKCKGPLNGPQATGNHCPEGWTAYKYPGPGFEGLGDNSAEFELLHLGRPAQHARAGRQHPDVHRQPAGRLRRAQRRPDGPAAHPVPDGLLCQGLRRAHR